MRKLVLIVLTLALVGAAWVTMSETGRVLTGRWSYTEKAVVDRGTYFRLKVDFDYKGEPQHFDIVVGCNVRSIRYKDGSGTYEAGLIPAVYGRRMSDGKAVVVRPPDACRGDTTANGGVPENFLPVMIVYDDADTVAFGTGYMTDEAYDNPRSVMKFDKATVERATRADFDAFRESGPPNVVTRSQYHSVQSDKHLASLGLQRIYPAFGWHCHAYSRWKLSEPEREVARNYRKDGVGKYWMISDVQKRVAFEKEIYAARAKIGKRSRDDGLILNLHEGFWQPDFGALRRDGVKLVGIKGIERAASFYPANTLMSQDKWPPSPEERAAAYEVLKAINVVDIDARKGQNRGFAYCYATEWEPKQFEANVKATAATVTVDKSPVTGALQYFSRRPSDVSIVLEGDEFIFMNHVFYLESTRGDL